jgi:hypothetical protein
MTTNHSSATAVANVAPYSQARTMMPDNKAPKATKPATRQGARRSLEEQHWMSMIEKGNFEISILEPDRLNDYALEQLARVAEMIKQRQGRFAKASQMIKKARASGSMRDGVPTSITRRRINPFNQEAEWMVTVEMGYMEMFQGQLARISIGEPLDRMIRVFKERQDRLASVLKAVENALKTATSLDSSCFVPVAEHDQQGGAA